MFQTAAHDVHHSKSVPVAMVNVSFVFKLWKHQSNGSTGKNVDVVNWISFEIDVLGMVEVHWLQQGTNPSQESALLVFHHVEPLIHVFVNENRKVNF